MNVSDVDLFFSFGFSRVFKTSGTTTGRRGHHKMFDTAPMICPVFKEIYNRFLITKGISPSQTLQNHPSTGNILPNCCRFDTGIRSEMVWKYLDVNSRTYLYQQRALSCCADIEQKACMLPSGSIRITGGLKENGTF